MSDLKYKFQLYRKLEREKDEIYAEARKAAAVLNIPAGLQGNFGLTGAISGCPAPIRNDILAATEIGAKKVIPLKSLIDEMREIVKDVYGDGYDVVATPTCEAALWLSFDVLATPPNQGRGDNYRARYISLYEKHLHHHGSYGRPFPGKYKDILSDRGSTAGELGFYGKRQNNLDVIIARLVGANYEPHGIKYYPTLQLTGVDPKASIARIKEIACRHENMLTAITSLGYDTPGYGYGVHDREGAPLLQRLLGELAEEYDIPYIVDNAWGLPFVGTDISKIKADVMAYSMDKATGAPTSGLIIGKEEIIVQLRRALGMHGDRWGTTASYGKAAYVIFDPGKEALLGQIAALKALRNRPEIYTKPVDETYEIVVAEFEKIPPELRKGIVISKSYNSGTVEVNYEQTWQGNQFGIPIFSIEDMYASSHLIQTGLKQMGIIPTIAYDGNIFISPGQGTTDLAGNLLEDRMRLAVRGLVELLMIVARHAEIIN
ncbi:MAG: hypothetical protein UMV23_01440 [Halanaerobium sp.]|nr:hypothetical protein [Halanaerobium sp.]